MAVLFGVIVQRTEIPSGPCDFEYGLGRRNQEADRMKPQQIISACILLVPLAFVGGYSLGTAARVPPGQPEVEAYFSPNGGCTAAVVQELGRARESIEMQAFSFTSSPIARALVAAHRRGVQVTVVLDPNPTNDQGSEARYLVKSGVPTYVDAQHPIAHNKIILIDGETIITGSFNFTNQAERGNAENLLVIRNDPPLSAKYQANFREHREHSERFDPAAEVNGDRRESNPSRGRLRPYPDRPAPRN